MALTDLLIPSFTQMLRALSAWLEKAQAQRADAEDLLAKGLAPDMLPLSTQVRFACIQAYEAVSRLRGEAFPVIHQALLEEGRQGRDNPGALVDAQARIRETLAFLETVAPGDLDASAPRAIAHALPNGMTFDLSDVQYARDWVLPQFYFHLMTAYAILRAQGVDLGKADYVTHMFAYLRPGTAPPETPAPQSVR
ncbi:MAG: DUF1993 family protein [Maricaulaceae bacterium]